MDTIAEIVRNAAGMAWKIVWGLVLGFAISGFIQACVSKERVAGVLGDLNARSLGLATLFGMASSSCSYAAAAMSKSLFQKGAHIINATAFLFASTNLVIEIGLVIWSLLGWHFVAAEFFGGVLLILVVSLLLRWFAPRSVIEEARRHLDEVTGDEHQHGGLAALSPADVLSRKGLAAAGRYFVADWKMVGTDIALGVAIAGTLAAVVPETWWQALFLSSGSGSRSLWVLLENAVVGPVIAILSFVCSVGNIPLAAVLWSHGISFSGVVAFIFADLVTIPMVLVYRRYYGWKPALVYAAYLLATMIIAALIVEGAFAVLGIVPEPGAGARAATKDYFAWDYTTALNLIFLPVGAALAWLGTRPRRA
jgi:uncharacterized membrane protein YraQ (UPF0718 family)